MRLFFFSLSLLWIPLWGQGQVKSVLLEAVEIRPGTDSIPLAEIIDLVQTDTSFYSSFRETRNPGYQTRGVLRAYGNREATDTLGTIERLAISEQTGTQGRVHRLTETGSKTLLKRKNRHRYLTGRMFDQVFFPEGTYPLGVPLSREFETNSGSRMDQFENQLKQLLFNPGTPIPGVPFMGDKLAIFSEEMQEHYHYEVWKTTLGEASFIAFSVEAKVPESNATVIKKLTTFIHADDFFVHSRAYHLAYSHLLLDFDIQIGTEIAWKTVPNYIRKVSYQGYFDIPFSKPERVDFDINITAQP